MNHHIEFLVRPGEGEDFVYSPVEVNATLYCAVNDTYLVWEVDRLNFDTAFKRDTLHSRGIFQNGLTTLTNSVTASYVIVFGNVQMNNNSRICCQSLSLVRQELRESCTTLIIYGMMHCYLL